MAEETVQEHVAVAPEHVELKPEAVEITKDKEDWKGSHAPYHTAETEKIAEDRAKDVDEDKPYEYCANGYTVKEVEGDNFQAADPKDAHTLWQVTADDFEKVFTNKREAEIFVETHSLAHKDMPATVPST